VSRPIVKLILAGALSLTVAATASAYLASAGSGGGSGGTDVARALTVTAATPTQQLIPTGTATGDVAVTLANAGGTPLHVDRLVLDMAQGSGGYSANAATCSVSFDTAAWHDNGGAGWTVPAAAGGTPGTVTADLVDTVTMGTGAPSSCQGQSFAVHLKTAP
jgi:hypothetical protein